MHQRSYNWLNKVREGKPSLACREDEERFCLCGRVERKGTTTWRCFLLSTCNFGHTSVYLSSRFLCGTCNISFKLDRRKGLKVDGKKKELASRTISVPAKKGLWHINWSDFLRPDSAPRLGNIQTREDGCSWQVQWRERWKDLWKSLCVRNHRYKYLSILRAIMYSSSQSPNPILLRVFLRCLLASLLLLWGTSFTHFRISRFLKIIHFSQLFQKFYLAPVFSVDNHKEP